MANVESILAAGRADYILGRKAALRSLIWFGFGAHEVLQNGTPKEQTAYFEDLAAILRDSGAVRSEMFAKKKQAKQIGERFFALFGKELATSYRTEADFVQACFVAAQAAGATSVARLVDWATKGNPNATDEAKEAKEAEKAAEKEAARAESMAAIAAAPVAQMGFDAEPALAPVQNLDRAQEAPAIDYAAIAAGMSDEQLAGMAQAIAAEIAARAAAAQVKAA